MQRDSFVCCLLKKSGACKGKAKMWIMISEHEGDKSTSSTALEALFMLLPLAVAAPLALVAPAHLAASKPALAAAAATRARPLDMLERRGWEPRGGRRAQPGPEVFIDPELPESKVFRTKSEVTGASFGKIWANPTEFKEVGRVFRQDVYSPDDWRWHREAGHVFEAAPTVFTSSIGKVLWRECAFVILCALSVCLWNDGLPMMGNTLGIFIPAFQDLGEARPLIHLPLLPLTLSSPALFLLLVFRTNASYDRWWEARKVWGSIINTSRDHARGSLAMHHDDWVKEKACKQVVAYNRILKYHLRKPTTQSAETLRSEITEIGMDQYEIDLVMRASHKPMTILGLLAKNIHGDLDTQLTDIERMKLDQSLTLLTDYLGMCERIFKTPMPLVYSRHTARFLSWWLLWLPVCLYDQLPTHWMVVPMSGIIAFFLIGIEELGNQIEEPFSLLPLKAMGDGIQGSVFEALDINQGKGAADVLAPGVTANPCAERSSNPAQMVR